MPAARNISFRFLVVAATVVALSVGPAARAQARMLEGVEAETLDGGTAVRIEFSAPLQYVTHTPPRRGNVVQIQLRPVSPGSLTQDLSGNESIGWRSSGSLPLPEVSYDGEAPGGPQLTLRFAVPVRFRVEPAADLRRLAVVVEAPAAPAPDPAPEPTETVNRAEAVRNEAARPAQALYVLNLESSQRRIRLPAADSHPAFRGRILYQSSLTLDGRVWHRLRLGFFSNLGEAGRAKQLLRDRYPRAWVARATAAELALARGEPTAEAAGESTARNRGASPPLPPLPVQRLAELMEEARAAMVRKEYRRAVQLYTKILQYPDHPYRQAAREFLGLARERRGQFAHAKAEYERYLAEYPDSDGAARVRQRLLAITTARASEPRPPLRAARRPDPAAQWETFGSFSQFYRRDNSVTDALGSVVNRSSLSSDIDVSARRRSDAGEIRARFTGGSEHDFLDNGPGDEARVAFMYADAANRDRSAAMRLGRQSRSTGGVLGRFDGVHAAYQASERARLNLVAGYPVDSSSDSPQTERVFYGASVDLGTYSKVWDFVLFFIDQRIGDLTDRRAVGGEVRYFAPGRSLLGLADYDIGYDALNTFLLIGNWTLADRTTLNLVVDYRRSPLLTTRNALQGQLATTIEELQQSFTEDEIRQLAEDRSAESRTVTIGASRPLSEKLQISADLTVTSLGGTPASGGVPAIPGTGNDYFLNVQLLGSNLIKSGDIAILGLRYADTSTAQTTSLSLNTRYPVTAAWRLNPRIRLDHRDNRDGSTQWTVAPSLRTEYRWKRHVRLELEAGAEWTLLDADTGTDDSAAYFLVLGYRTDF